MTWWRRSGKARCAASSATTIYGFMPDYEIRDAWIDARSNEIMKEIVACGL